MTESHARNSSENFAGSSASVLFDLLRGLAALFVVGGHWRHVLYVDYPEVTAYRRLLALPYLLASAGHEAVIVFFVLSGYFVGGSVFRAAEKGQWRWSDYLLRRFARLWIVLVPALLLGLFWDRLGMSLGHAPGLYLGKGPNQLLPYDVSAYLSPMTFLGNLFFLQTIAVHALGSNGALWSLANEFWYYILFPLGYFGLRPSSAWRERAVCGLLFAGAAYLVGFEILALFPIWLAGAALVVLPKPGFSEAAGRWLRPVAVMVYAPLPIFLSRKTDVLLWKRDYLLTAATVLLLWILQSANRPSNARSLRVRATRTLARFSYSLYALHTPLLIFLASVAEGDSRWVPTPAHAALGVAILATLLAYAWMLAAVTEFRTDAVRRWLEVTFGMRSRMPLVPSDPVAPRPAEAQRI